MGRASNRRRQQREQSKYLPTIALLREHCDSYDNLRIARGQDCFYMSAILDWHLSKQGIPHTMMLGAYHPESGIAAIENTHSHYYNVLHAWIAVETREGSAIVDYRARATIGAEGGTPHGVFLKKAYPQMVYRGRPVPQVYSEATIHHLLDPFAYPMPATFEAERHAAENNPAWEAYFRLTEQLTPEMAHTEEAYALRYAEAGEPEMMWRMRVMDEHGNTIADDPIGWTE